MEKQESTFEKLLDGFEALMSLGRPQDTSHWSTPIVDEVYARLHGRIRNKLKRLKPILDNYDQEQDDCAYTRRQLKSTPFIYSPLNIKENIELELKQPKTKTEAPAAVSTDVLNQRILASLREPDELAEAAVAGALAAEKVLDRLSSDVRMRFPMSDGKAALLVELAGVVKDLRREKKLTRKQAKDIVEYAVRAAYAH